MPTIAFHYPARRHHATPWGHHVNEGLVEWPPSPWRLLRALIAVGYASLGWREVPERARRLLGRLTTVLPTYRVPPAALGHSRHYMPIGGLRKDGVEQTTLVFDAWARIEAGELVVSWPVDLPDDERALLVSLAARMGYLGRSESWVEARVVDEPTTEAPSGERVYPCEAGDHPGAGWEQVALLAPETPDAYEAFRAARVDTVDSRGRAPKRTAKGRDVEDCPRDVVGCLQMQTAELHAQGWSQPPGSRRVLYWRRSNALEAGAPPVVAVTAAAPPVEVALFALAAPNGSRGLLPRCRRTLPLAELLHKALVQGLPRSVEELIGKDAAGAPLTGHRHAHVLPLGLDGDEHIDHVLVWAPRGLSGEAQAALRRVRRTYAKDVTELRLALEGLGDVELFAERMPGVFGSPGGSTEWVSATPFVAPRHLRGRGPHSLEGQLQAELASRRLPELVSFEILPRDTPLVKRLPSFRHFVLERGKGRPPPVHLGYALRIVLSEPRGGPICLGYASHFGLGRFEARLDLANERAPPA